MDMRVSVRAAAVVLALGAWACGAAAPPGGRPPRGGGGALEAAITEIEAGRETTPLVGGPGARGGVTVTFLARAEGGRAPRIVSDVTGWGEHVDGTFDFTVGAMTPVGNAGWYALQATVARGARIEYQIAYDVHDYRLDPHNPRRLDEPPASEFVTPGYEPPPDLAGAPVPRAGRLEETAVRSRALGATARLAVYTPPDDRHDGSAAVVVFHGMPAEVARRQQVPRVLDWLIAHGTIEPILAVFEDAPPHGDGANAHTFLTRELPAWLASRYGVTGGPDRRAIVGISFGAKDALDAALAPSSPFGRLGLSIPGRRITSADIDAIRGRRARPLRVAIVAGRYDRANLPTARGLRRALTEAGHGVRYVEVPEGHSPRTWRHHLRDLLVGLFGAERAAPLGVVPPGRGR